MFTGQELRDVWQSSSSSSSTAGRRQTLVKNLIDFEQCDLPLVCDAPPTVVPSSSSVAATSTSALPSSSSSAFLCSPSRPVRPSQATTQLERDIAVNTSPHELLEEIQYLRQMLADANEEKNIMVAIHVDELAEKQRVIHELTAHRLICKDANSPDSEVLNLPRQKHAEAYEEDLARIKKELENARNLHQRAEEKCRALQESEEVSMKQLAVHREQIGKLESLLVHYEAPEEALAAVSSAEEIAAWERRLREDVHLAVGRLSERHVALRVAAFALQDVALCKICFDRPVSCVLLPCKHHAFCMPCAQRIKCRSDGCPLCRALVTGVMETFAG